MSSYTPATSSGMTNHLAGNAIFVCPAWKIISRDGLTAAYASHSRSSVGRVFNPAPAFTFGSVTYKPARVQNTRDLHKIGVSPDSTEITGFFDDVITRADVEGGRWKLAKVTYEYLCYFDLSLGSTGKIIGVVGSIVTKGFGYKMEFLSNGNILQQLIGELTSPTDRNTFPAGLDKADYTVVRHVVSSADRRHLIIDGAAPVNDYYKNGVVVFTTGANSRYTGMEIKSNTGSAIELQLPMPSEISGETTLGAGDGDTVALLAGYDGTREQLRDKFADMESGNFEPDLPGLRTIFSYPE